MSTGDSGVVVKLRNWRLMLLCWTLPITAVTGSCQASVTAASISSSAPEMISTDEMSRMKRLTSRSLCPIVPAAWRSAAAPTWCRRATPGPRR